MAQDEDEARVSREVNHQRNYLAGMWAAELMGLIGRAAGDYAKSVMHPGHDAEAVHGDDQDKVIVKLMRDLEGRANRVEIRARMAHFMTEARRQLKRGSTAKDEITLYHHPLSIFARRIVMALMEKGIEYRPVLVDMAKGEHKGEVYRALNPYGRVPTLAEANGFVLYESSAILEYLEETHPNPPLLPKDPHQRALVRMHMKLADIEMAPHVVAIIFPKRFLPPERWDTAAMDKARAALERHVTILEGQLAGKTYLVGERFTLADLSYVPFVEFLPLLEVAPPPAVAAWTQRLLSRPSAVATKPAV